MKPSKNLLLISSMISLLCSLTCALGPLSQSTIPNFQLLTKHDSSSLSASSKIQVSPIYSLSLVFTFFFLKTGFHSVAQTDLEFAIFWLTGEHSSYNYYPIVDFVAIPCLFCLLLLL